jgi:natural product biosynthesis luciferase-like monooxygenase protein/amino acid adenylation domain-containing protein
MSDTTVSTTLTPLQKAYAAITQLRQKVDQLEKANHEPIAIVGLSCRAPGANTPEQLWSLIRDGKDAITEIPVERWDAQRYYDPKPGQPGKSYTRRGGFIDGADQFDPAFFNISAREAEGMDPQQRILLEVAWEALERAGIAPNTLVGSATGVFIGVTASDYGLLQAMDTSSQEVNPYFNTGTPLNGCAGRLSYVMGLQGPCMAIDTACSSSLTAIHLACSALRAKECNAALAGGVNLTLSPLLYVTLSAAGMMAPDGQCKSFDDAANGYVRGEGCGIVVLKRYSDAIANGDQILGLIRGSGVNQDGASSGFTVPNGVAQQSLIRHTLERAGVAPQDIDYVEAHGTGTPLGDPIEAQALGSVLGQSPTRVNPLMVGSIKSNIGHLESAAGVMGLIKLVLAMQNELIPRTLHLHQPNTRIDWKGLNIQPLDEPVAWPRTEAKTRFASVSAFGASGSNAHLVLEEAPTSVIKPTSARSRSAQVLALSGKTDAALKDIATHLRDYLATHTELSLEQLCFNQNTGRNQFNHRLALVASNRQQALEALAAFADNRPTAAVQLGRQVAAKVPSPVFLFTGQGGVYPGMGHELYDTQPIYQQAIDRCAQELDTLIDAPLLGILSPDSALSGNYLSQARYAQPALFAVQYALASLWRSFGLEPAAVLGHSIGEYAAACVAGALSLSDALKLVVKRADLMQSLEATGGMTAVLADEQTVRQAIGPYLDDIDLGVVNGQNNVVVSGSPTVIKRALAPLVSQGVQTIDLNVTHAFHSPQMQLILEPLEQFAQTLVAKEPEVLYVSGVTGTVLTTDQALDAKYWRRHCRDTVQFASGLNTLIERGHTLFIEIGPGQVLSNLGKQARPEAHWLTSIVSKQTDWKTLSQSVATAFVAGAQIDWSGFEAGHATQKITLPAYSFQRKRYWITQKDSAMITPINNSAAAPVVNPQVVRHQHVLTKLCELFSVLLRIAPEDIDVHAQLVEMGADSLVLVSGVSVIEDNFGVKLEIRQFFEEITSLDAIAAHLAQHSVLQFGQQAPAASHLAATAVAAPTQPLAAPQQAAPQTVAPQFVAPQVVVPQAVAPQVVAQTYAALPTPNTHSIAATALQPVSAEHLNAMQQIVLAQTQLMSQQLAILNGSASALQTAPLTQAVSAPQPTSVAQHTSVMQHTSAPTQTAAHAVVQPQATKVVTAPVAPVAEAEDRSSPLRALNAPIVPNNSSMTAQQNAHLAALVERYQARTAKSKALAQAARPALADSRASVGFRFSTKEILYPITGVESTGSRLRDIDGNEYVDLTMGFGVLLFGSRPEHMKGVLEAEIKQGFQLGPRSEHMLEIAQLFTEITGHERVGFTNSGTEAIMIALRLARAATGRDKIVIFDRAYNGHSDGTLAKTVRSLNGELNSEPVAPGIPLNVAKDVLVLDYGNPESLEIIRKHAHELAAVLVEPVQSRRLDLQPIEFLRELRTLTRECDVALIFDEMVSGFRAHPAGFQGMFGIKADLATYGKIVGGGTPVGAVAGDARYMDGIDGGMWQYGDASYPTAKRTYFGGTFNQHPFSMAAALATLRHLKASGPALQENLNRRTAAFAQTLNTFFENEELSIRVVTFASTFGFKFSGNIEMFFYHLLEKGVYIWEWRACFLSTAHTDQDLDFVINAIKETIQEMRNGGFLPPRGGGIPLTKKTEPVSLALATGQSKIAKASKPALATASHSQAQALNFGLYFFGNYDAAFSTDKYDLLMQGSRYGDKNGFNAVWLPERHFDKFGGFSPNPSVLAAALARETDTIQLRAGSVVMPLHHPLRVAEEWALVDNLSHGRAGISFASGWHPNDFALAPENFSNNREVTFDGITTVKRLWAGESVRFLGGDDKEVELSIYPRPKQQSLPAWLTVVGNPDTYRKAGEMGLGILTNLLGQSLEELEKNIAIYRQALTEHGHPSSAGNVAVLIHTYICEDHTTAVETARAPMCNYLLSSLSLFQKMAESLPAHLRDVDRASEADKAFIVAKAYERYIATRALIGSPEHCQPMLERLSRMGVNEIACFLDFGIAADSVMASLPNLTRLKHTYAQSLIAGQQTHEQPANSFALSEAQHQLWLLARMDPDGSRAYNDPASLLFTGRLNISFLQQSLQKIVERHESLRTRIEAESGQWQVIEPITPVMLDIIDVSEQPDPHGAAREWMLAKSGELASFSRDKLFYPTLLKLAPEQHILVLWAHHIISDGPSMGIVIQETLSLYESAVKGADLELPVAPRYAAFVNWHAQQAQAVHMQAHESYWLKQFAQPIEPLALACDYPRPAVKTFNGSRLRVVMAQSLASNLKGLANRNGCTLYMLLTAAYCALLHRLTEQQKLVIGAPYAGRGIDGAQGLVGYCVHMLPILSELQPGASFRSHLASIKQTLLEAYEHQDYPFARLIDKLNVKRDPSRSALVSTIFNLERLPKDIAVADVIAAPYPQPIRHTRVDLTFTLNLIGDDIILEADYNTDLFKASSIERMVQQYESVLEAICLNIDLPVSRLALLTQGKRDALLASWQIQSPAAPAVCFHSLFEQVASVHANNNAVLHHPASGSALTYGALNQQANQLARRLRGLGVGPDQRVGVCLPRSTDLIVAMLATMKAGGAYLPMDPSYPANRLNYLQQDANVSVLITSAEIAEQTRFSTAQLFCIDQERARTELEDDTNLTLNTDPSNLAYVIYTSGSTGQPKGALMTHAGMTNYLQWAAHAYEASVGDGSPVLGSIGFDATITSIFVPLVAGNQVILLPEGVEFEAIQALVNSPYEYSFIKLTPAHLEILNTLRAQNPAADAKLAKYLILGGEALSGASLDPWFDHTATLGINEYGPTETVVGCCTFVATQPTSGSVPIGQAIQGTRLYVLDPYLEPVAVGMEGELYIGGAGLARGYHDRPGQTAAAFVPDPFCGEVGASGDRLYKTGDRVKYREDGCLIFLGRMDNQIKLNGFRIEPGEIEAALVDLAAVREAAVMVREDQPGQKRLVAYLTLDQKAQAQDSASLRQQLLKVLPAHMVPSVFVTLTDMPLTSHAKIDRQQLPVPSAELTEPSGDLTLPSNDREEQIARAWCAALSLPKVGVHENFFDIGGNSLLLLQIFKTIEPLLPAHFLIVDLFRYPTIASLSEHLGRQDSAPATDIIEIQQRAALQKSAATEQAKRQRAAKSAVKTRRQTA